MRAATPPCKGGALGFPQFQILDFIVEAPNLDSCAFQEGLAAPPNYSRATEIAARPGEVLPRARAYTFTGVS